jgi:hypothetical protein
MSGPSPPERGNKRAMKHGAYSLPALEPQAREIEKLIWSSMPWLEQSDALMVRKAALAVAREAAAQGDLDRHGYTTGRGQLRPMVKVISSFSAEARRHLEALAGTPARRAELGLTVAQGQSLIERMALESRKGETDG